MSRARINPAEVAPAPKQHEIEQANLQHEKNLADQDILRLLREARFLQDQLDYECEPANRLPKIFL